MEHRGSRRANRGKGVCSKPARRFPRRRGKIYVSVPLIHGGADRVLPLEATAERLPALIKDSKLVVIEDGPHAVICIHADKVNSEIMNFLGKADQAKV